MSPKKKLKEVIKSRIKMALPQTFSYEFGNFSQKYLSSIKEQEKNLKKTASKEMKITLSKQITFESFRFEEENRQTWSDVDSNDWVLCLENSTEFNENLKYLLP